MARKLRVQYSGAIYHVINRGDRREAIFVNDADRERPPDLVGPPKGHPGKVKLALLLRANTTMPLAWVAERLQMGSRGYLIWLLQHQNKKKGEQTDTFI